MRWRVYTWALPPMQRALRRDEAALNLRSGWKVALEISILRATSPFTPLTEAANAGLGDVVRPMTRKPPKRRTAADQDKIIVEALRGVGRPVSAYELIEQVRAKGVSAPPTVYRALQRLIGDGLGAPPGKSQRVCCLQPSASSGQGGFCHLRCVRDG